MTTIDKKGHASVSFFIAKFNRKIFCRKLTNPVGHGTIIYEISLVWDFFKKTAGMEAAPYEKI